MATDFQKDALLPTAQSVFHDSDGSGSIDWADGSYTEYDTEGQMIAKSHSMFMKPTIKDYIDKMFPQSKWKLGE